MLEAGGFIDDYELMRPLGEGGFGQVWSARHRRLGHQVAIKFAEAGDDPERGERFLREARLAASIKHRHVVEVIDFGREGDQTFMVMELATGHTLADLVDARLDPALGVRVFTQLMKAVEACHRGGVVHRDLKPENVFVDVDEDGGVFVKLVDFGISKVTASAKDRGRRSAIPTREGIIVGTPQYMAPEQARGDGDLDFRADVYALGIMIYEVFTGELPFDGASPAVILGRVVLGDCEPMATRCPDYPALAAVVDRAIRLEREDRFPDVVSMRHALNEAARLDLGTSSDSWPTAMTPSGPIVAGESESQPGDPPAMSGSSPHEGFPTGVTSPWPPSRAWVSSVAAIAAAVVLLVVVWIAVGVDQGPVPSAAAGSAEAARSPAAAPPALQGEATAAESDAPSPAETVGRAVAPARQPDESDAAPAAPTMRPRRARRSRPAARRRVASTPTMTSRAARPGASESMQIRRTLDF